MDGLMYLTPPGNRQVGPHPADAKMILQRNQKFAGFIGQSECERGIHAAKTSRCIAGRKRLIDSAGRCFEW
jgi:hypothetical protein